MDNIKVKIFLLDGTIYEVEFPNCHTLEDVRKWLNNAAPFITIKNLIINSNQIHKIESV